MANAVQIFLTGSPLLAQGVTMDGVNLSVQMVDAGVTRRAPNGKLWIQKSGTWKKRVLTISGSGMDSVTALANLLREQVVVTSTGLADLAGVVTEVTAPTRDVYGKIDAWSLTVEEY